MTFLEFAIVLLIAAICGAVGQALAGTSRGGFVASIAVGFLGAMLGTWLAPRLGLPEILSVRVGDVRFPVVWSIAGSALFVAVLGMIARSGRSRK